MQKQMRAIIIGTGHHNTLGLIRSLGEVGSVYIELVLIGNRNSFVATSKYVDRVHYCKPAELPTYLDGMDDGKPAVLFPAGDDSALYIDNYMAARPNTAFLAPSLNHQYGFLGTLMEKERFSDAVVDTSLRIPKAFTVDIGDFDTSSFESALADHGMTYPVILKPSASIHGSKTDIQVLHSNDHLSTFISTTPPQIRTSSILVQEYIDMDAEYGVQGIAFSDGAVYIPGVISKIRKSVISKGSTTYALLLDSDPYIDISSIQRLIRNTGFMGIFDVELMRKGNDLYLCEINFRNGAYGYAYTKAGANLPYYWLCDCLNLPCGHISEVSCKSLISEIADWYFARHGVVPFLTWLKQFLTADVKLYWNAQDPKPFVIRFLKKFI